MNHCAGAGVAGAGVDGSGPEAGGEAGSGWAVGAVVEAGGVPVVCSTRPGIRNTTATMMRMTTPMPTSTFLFMISSSGFLVARGIIGAGETFFNQPSGPRKCTKTEENLGRPDLR